MRNRLLTQNLLYIMVAAGLLFFTGCASNSDPNWDYTTVTVRVEPGHPILVDQVHDLEAQGWMVYKVSHTEPAVQRPYSGVNQPYGFPDNQYWYYYYSLRRPKNNTPVAPQ